MTESPCNAPPLAAACAANAYTSGQGSSPLSTPNASGADRPGALTSPRSACASGSIPKPEPFGRLNQPRNCSPM